MPSSAGTTPTKRPRKPAGGISTCFVAQETDDEEPNGPRVALLEPASVAEQPGDAKVLLTTQHCSYLLSAKGQAFLVEAADACRLTARLDFTSVGYVLLIHGLPSDQDAFHQRLLAKYEELAEEKQRPRETSCQVPKRIDVLVRFLREHIAVLLKPIGNVNDLMRRLPHLEKVQSKNSVKLAERARRSLNMILVGQAGLLDGGSHLEELLAILRRLLNEFGDGDTAPVELRHQIDTHWRMIFSSQRHKNYPDLVQTYNRMRSRNQLPVLNIDPWLLGRGAVNVKLTAEQRERLEQPSSGQKSINNNNNKAAARHSVNQMTTTAPTSATPKSGPSKAKSNNNTNTNSVNPSGPTNVQGKRRADATAKPAKSPANTPNTSKRSPAGAFAVPPKPSVPGWQAECQTLLKTIDKATTPAGNDSAKSVMKDSMPQSMFWSRESIKYIENSKGLLQSHPVLLEQLKRVETKAIGGLLSYNDYRAIIKLNTALRSKSNVE